LKMKVAKNGSGSYIDKAPNYHGLVIFRGRLCILNMAI
jgi:hypothetical protein